MSLETGDDAFEKAHKQGFAPTPWSVVMAAAVKHTPEGHEALEKLCRAYWPPIFAHLRYKGYSLHQAQDLAQEFFHRLLEGNAFAAVSPAKGRFRTFLLAALKYFLINEWKREKAIKRGGGVQVIDLDGLDPAVRSACEPHAEEDPMNAYDRRWALTLIAKVRSRLRREYETADQLDRHEILKTYLVDGKEPQSCADTAAALGISEAAAKSAIYRIRQRFGQLLRMEITRTVTDEAEVDDELRYLFNALRH